MAQIVAPDVEQQVAGLRALVAEREAELERQRKAADQEIKANRKALDQREEALVQIQADSRRRAEALQRGSQTDTSCSCQHRNPRRDRGAGAGG